jgi:hypothetical protein
MSGAIRRLLRHFIPSIAPTPKSASGFQVIFPPFPKAVAEDDLMFT